jgi:hypothetical protein
MSRYYARSRAFTPDPDAPDRACDVPGCGERAAYRAPKSRQQLTDYWWFCLEHVRGYNASWDYYKGMTPGQIELELRADASWQRPSWPLGRIGGRTQLEEGADPLHLLDALRGEPRRSCANRAPAALREPLAVLGLTWPVTLTEVKSRYKDLAKRHHPDANNGDRAAEERLKTINLAYAALRSHLAPLRTASS